MGAENGVEQAQKSGEQERGKLKIWWSRSRVGVEQ